MKVTYCARNGLLALFDPNLLTFARRFLLHGTGSAGGLPRLALKRLVWSLRAVDFDGVF